MYNRALRQGHRVMKNAFGILEQTWWELLIKSDIDVHFLPNVIFCCAILYNTILERPNEEVEALLHVLHQEGLHGEVVNNNDDNEVDDHGGE